MVRRFLRCLSIDLEVDPGKAKIFAFAAVRRQGQEKVVFRRGNQEAALDQLEGLAAGADFLLGHNIIRFDLPHLAAVRPRLARIATKPIDTLWLNPLAFPRNPYNHLVKHHHDGRLHAGHVNDPELDARLVLDVLANDPFWSGYTGPREITSVSVGSADGTIKIAARRQEEDQPEGHEDAQERVQLRDTREEQREDGQG